MLLSNSPVVNHPPPSWNLPSVVCASVHSMDHRLEPTVVLSLWHKIVQEAGSISIIIPSSPRITILYRASRAAKARPGAPIIRQSHLALPAGGSCKEVAKNSQACDQDLVSPAMDRGARRLNFRQQWQEVVRILDALAASFHNL